jgi:hypothetical protein
MRIITEKKLNITSQKLNESCEIIISVRKKNAEIIFAIFDNMFEIEINKI